MLHDGARSSKSAGDDRILTAIEPEVDHKLSRSKLEPSFRGQARLELEQFVAPCLATQPLQSLTRVEHVRPPCGSELSDYIA